MEPTAGQRLISALVDITFFVVMCLLGLHQVLKELSLVTLLMVYAQGRFTIAKDKQLANMFNGPGGPGSNGGSGNYRAQRKEIIESVPTRESAPIKEKSRFPNPIPRNERWAWVRAVFGNPLFYVNFFLLMLLAACIK